MDPYFTWDWLILEPGGEYAAEASTMGIPPGVVHQTIILNGTSFFLKAWIREKDGSISSWTYVSKDYATLSIIND